MKNLALSLALLMLCFNLYGQAPTAAATTPVFSNIEGNTITLSWTNGNGAGRIVVARAGAAPQFVPDGMALGMSADANFGSGDDVSWAGRGEYIVYDGNDNNVTITNLQHSATYYFEVFEYNGFGMSRNYLTTATLTASQPTLFPPTTGSTAATSTQPTSTSMTLNWTNGNGANRLVVVKQGSAVTGGDTQYFPYAANAVFGSGDQLLAGLFVVYNGEYVVYNGTGNTVTVTGLTAGQTYYYKIIEYNGNTGPVYNNGAGLAGSVPDTPLPLTWISFTGKKLPSGIELNWVTASEVNTKNFVVERSTDGQKFAPIATVNAEGEASNHYNYVDATARGAVYYRLKQVDIDGKFEYSKVITIQAPDQENAIALFPNPAVDRIAIPLKEKAVVKVFDEKGQLVMTKSVLPSETIQVSHLNTGTYFVEVTGSSKTYTSRFIKK